MSNLLKRVEKIEKDLGKDMQGFCFSDPDNPEEIIEVKGFRSIADFLSGYVKSYLKGRPYGTDGNGNQADGQTE